jgi:hypothetical protein
MDKIEAVRIRYYCHKSITTGIAEHDDDANIKVYHGLNKGHG